MIRYPINRENLDNLLENQRPDWPKRAKDRTDKFRKIKRYKEKSSIWSEVKVVYMRLQHDKCAYCERKLESETFGKIEHDLEHFRPKKRVRYWKPSSALSSSLSRAGLKLTAPLSGKEDPGYYLLAYHPLNYCTACKSCNSSLKRDYFPIAGVRKPSGGNPAKLLASEKPYLIYPIGHIDRNPRKLIRFNGVSPIAVYKRQNYKRHRALVTIEFFKLDAAGRKNLFRERAMVIALLHHHLVNQNDASVKGLTKPSAPHTNCARSFVQLYRKNPAKANKIYSAVNEFLNSTS